ncbi:MAG TPA: transposase [Candidatus Acidoferrales bacterium]|nr:transposase [Candidatus Acidoferrales bacterium]
MQNRKVTRLDRTIYIGCGSFFVTICCAARRTLFASPDIAEWIISHLHSTAGAYRYRLHAWCVMPDHVHVLAEGTDTACNFLLFIRQFKLRASREWPAQSDGQLWQKGFYDHVVRTNDELSRIAAYIWMNPVRKGLCDDPRTFPFSGSQTFDWQQIAPPRAGWLPPWNRSQPL